MARRQQYIFTEETHRSRGFLVGTAVALALLAAVIFVWNFTLNHSVTFTREYVTLTKMPANEDFSILHLSDLNGTDIGSHQSAVKTALGSPSLSAVVMSGDMVGKDGNVEPLLDLVRVLPAGVPVLLLPSDNDPPLYANTAHSTVSAYSDWATRLKDAGVIILDEPVPFTCGKIKVWIVPEYLYGLDLESTQAAYQNQLDMLNASVGTLTPDQAAQKRTAEYQVERMKRIREAVASIAEKDVQVAVTHAPLSKEYIAAARAVTDSKTIFSMHHVSLVLAGSRCAGQWRLPGVGAIYVPELGFFPEDVLVTGMSYLDGVRQHISPGLGPSADYPFMPFRLLNQPGMTRLVLTSTQY